MTITPLEDSNARAVKVVVLGVARAAELVQSGWNSQGVGGGKGGGGHNSTNNSSSTGAGGGPGLGKGGGKMSKEEQHRRRVLEKPLVLPAVVQATVTRKADVGFVLLTLPQN